MRRLIACSLLLALTGTAQLGHAARHADALVTLTETCRFKPVGRKGVTLSTNFRLESVGGVPAKVRLVPGWNIGRHYPKARAARTIRLAAGQTMRFTVSRTIPHAPSLRNALERRPKPRCASVFEVMPASG